MGKLSGTNRGGRMTVRMSSVSRSDADQILDVHDSEHVVQRAVAHRVAGVPGPARDLEQFVERSVHVEEIDVGTGHHDPSADQVVELEDRVQEPMLGAAEQTVALRLPDDGADLLLAVGRIVLGAALDAHAAQQRCGRGVQGDEERVGEHVEHPEGNSDPEDHHLGSTDREDLRCLLADHQVQPVIAVNATTNAMV